MKEREARTILYSSSTPEAHPDAPEPRKRKGPDTQRKLPAPALTGSQGPKHAQPPPQTSSENVVPAAMTSTESQKLSPLGLRPAPTAPGCPGPGPVIPVKKEAIITSLSDSHHDPAILHPYTPPLRLPKFRTHTRLPTKRQGRPLPRSVRVGFPHRSRDGVYTTRPGCRLAGSTRLSSLPPPAHLLGRRVPMCTAAQPL